MEVTTVNCLVLERCSSKDIKLWMDGPAAASTPSFCSSGCDGSVRLIPFRPGIAALVRPGRLSPRSTDPGSFSGAGVVLVLYKYEYCSISFSSRSPTSKENPRHTKTLTFRPLHHRIRLVPIRWCDRQDYPFRNHATARLVTRRPQTFQMRHLCLLPGSPSAARCDASGNFCPSRSTRLDLEARNGPRLFSSVHVWDSSSAALASSLRSRGALNLRW